MVYKKLLLALILLLNHSLMYGVTEAAHIPDEDHPRGYAFHTNEHEHEDDHETPHSHESASQITAEQSASTGDLSGHSGHDHHHKHGAHVHLNCELPYSLNFDFDNPGSLERTALQFLHQSLSYSPPVPPPNR